jgi:DNA polymerase III delta prime subunit
VAPLYIANQVTGEGLDEIQRLLLAHRLGHHVAIDGPPGVGKTHCVMEVARMLSLPVYTKTCSSRTTESQIISFPVLSAENGTSVTKYMNGPLCLAMLEPGIFYGDEFNLLKEDVQKRLNSAFDERRMIDRMDGRQIEAQPGFWGVISYNPSESLVSRDLEDSVADRFVHLHYTRWDPDFKAYVATARARGGKSLVWKDNPFGIQFHLRGIGAEGSFLRGIQKNGKTVWSDFFTGGEAKEPPAQRYLVYDQASIHAKMGPKADETLRNLSEHSYEEVELARIIARYTDLMGQLAATGESPMLKRVGLGHLREKEDLELVSTHASSARIEMAAMKHYRLLLDAGWSRYLAQAYAVRLVIDQVCYGQYRERKLRESTVHGLAVMIAKNMRLLLDSTNYNTNLMTDRLLGKAAE